MPETNGRRPCAIPRDECFAEFRAAWYMRKRILAILIVASADRGDRYAKVVAEDQGIDCLACLTPEGELDLGRAGRPSTRLPTPPFNG